MPNDTTSERLWSLTDVAVINAVGILTTVRKLVFVPAVIDDDVVIQEYSPNQAGTLRSAIVLKANHTDVNPVSLDFSRVGRKLNGFKLSTIDGGVLYCYLGKD